MLFIARFHGLVYPGDHSQDFPLTRADFDNDEEFESCEAMSPGDTFALTETQILEAKDLKGAKDLARRLVKNWHKAHWSDCEWSVGQIKPVKSLKDVLKVLKPIKTVQELS